MAASAPVRPTPPDSSATNEAQRCVDAATAAQARGALQEAVALYEQALRLVPDHVDALLRYAILALGAGRADVALPLAERAAALDRRSALARNVHGVALRQRGRLADAIAALADAVALDPDYLDARINLGNALLDAGDAAAALPHYRKALALAPDAAPAHNNLGNLYRDLRRPTEAIAEYRRALELDPAHAWAHANLGNMLKDLGDTTAAIAAFRRSLALAPDRAEVWSNLLLTLNCADDVSMEAIVAEHRAFGAHFARLLPPLPPSAAPRKPGRLRVGYVSSDFRQHAVATFFEPLLTAHDRARFEVFCYYNQPRGDATTERIRGKAEHFVPVSGWPDQALAQRIRDDAVDVLVDLNGHSADNRLPLFFLHPAPVQATWLGYLGGTGVPTMDWRITDVHADPVDATPWPGMERPWRLPRTLWCYRPYPDAPAVAPLPATAQGQVTFACLNNPGKVTPSAIALWSEILRALPDSRLLLLTAADAGRMTQLHQAFAALGIATERVEFLARVPLADYLATYARADIALDTSPYAGGTTTCDALWMGVPVVTLAADRPFARSGASILANVGLDQLIATTSDEYVDKAVALARDVPALAALRSGLRARMLTSPLTDANAFARDFEAALAAMHEAALSSGSVKA